MKLLVSALMLAATFFGSSLAAAQDRKINGFTFDAPYNTDPAFIANRFEIKQIVTANVPVTNTVNAFSLGEQIAIDLKVNDYIGVSGRFLGSFQVGGNSNQSNYQVAASNSLVSDAGLNIRLFRAEDIGAQWVLHIKASYQRGSNVVINTANINFDEDYYKSLAGNKHPDIPNLIKHLKKDLKDNLSGLSSNTEYSYTAGAGKLSWAQTFHKNVAMQASAGLTIGKDPDQNGTLMQISTGIIGMVSLDPWLPITLRAEYEHETIGHTPTNLGLGSLVLHRDNVPISIILSAGAQSINDVSMPTGSVAFDYFY